MAEKEWVMVRITRAAHNRLRRYRATQLLLEDTGAEILPPSKDPRGGPPTWDAVITRLLDAVDAHRMRARRARQMKRARGKAVGPSPAPTTHTEET